MSVDKNDESSQALGTSAGVFWKEEEFVAARLDLFRVMEFLYEDGNAASDALLHFHSSLLSDDPLSFELRDKYSLEGMLDFIARFIIRENVLGLRWLTRLRITTVGLEFEMPDGQWSEIHIESVSNTYNWTKSSDDRVEEVANFNEIAERMKAMKPVAFTACSQFGLTCDADWQGVGRVYRQDGLSLWLPWD